MNFLPFITLVILFINGFAHAEDLIKENESILHNCGHQSFSDEGSEAEGRIVGGRRALHGEFPWLAVLNYIRKGANYFVGIKCGGAVINSRFILTAAHCLHFGDYALTSVWLGVRKISEADNIDYTKVQRFGIIETFKHPEYDVMSHINDIALLKLSRPLKYTKYVNKICLPNPGEDLPENGTRLWVSGWGQPFETPIGVYSDYKLKTTVPLYSYNECTDRLGSRVRNDQLCAEGDLFTGTCWGDGGGPLMERRFSGHFETYYATGVISQTTGCAASIRPVVHTRVSSYVNWITETINENYP